ncbi:uncharacterized protein LOC144617051 isoform X1 [Panthera onca]
MNERETKPPSSLSWSAAVAPYRSPGLLVLTPFCTQNASFQAQEKEILKILYTGCMPLAKKVNTAKPWIASNLSASILCKRQKQVSLDRFLVKAARTEKDAIEPTDSSDSISDSEYHPTR